MPPCRREAVSRPRGRRVTHQAKDSGERQLRPRPAHTATAARRAPLPAAGRSKQGKSGQVRGTQSRAPGMRKAAVGRPAGMSAKARTWSSPTAAQPVGRPAPDPAATCPHTRAIEAWRQTARSPPPAAPGSLPTERGKHECGDSGHRKATLRRLSGSERDGRPVSRVCQRRRRPTAIFAAGFAVMRPRHATVELR